MHKGKKCTLCSEFHADSVNNPDFKCPKTAKKCTNCGGEHTANCGGCKSYKAHCYTKQKKTEQTQDLSVENTQRVKNVEEKQDLIVKQNEEILQSIKIFQSEVTKTKQEF
jgi:hypothetical protein